MVAPTALWATVISDEISFKLIALDKGHSKKFLALDKS